MPREHPLSLHRVLPLALVGVLAVLALAAIFGPHWFQRLYYPVRFQETMGPRPSARDSTRTSCSPSCTPRAVSTRTW